MTHDFLTNDLNLTRSTQFSGLVDRFTHSVICEWAPSGRGTTHLGAMEGLRCGSRMPIRASGYSEDNIAQGHYRLAALLPQSCGLCRRKGTPAHGGSDSTLGPEREGSEGLTPTPRLLSIW